MRCVTPGGYSGHYKGIEEGAAYCHTRSTTCSEQDEEEGQRRAQNVGGKCRKNEENQEEPFLCFASSECCCCGASFSVLRWCTLGRPKKMLCVFWAYLVCIMQDICCLVLCLDMAQYCSLQSSFRTFHSRSIAL